MLIVHIFGREAQTFNNGVIQEFEFIIEERKGS